MFFTHTDTYIARYTQNCTIKEICYCKESRKSWSSSISWLSTKRTKKRAVERVTRLCTKIIEKREERDEWKKAKECVFMIRSAFPGEWKANRKVASYLDSMTFHRPSMLASSFSFHSALSFAYNSQDTSRHSFHKCNKCY